MMGIEVPFVMGGCKSGPASALLVRALCKMGKK